MNQLNNSDKEFREIFLDHLKIVHNMDVERSIRIEGRRKIKKMIMENKVSRMIVVSSVIEGLRIFPEKQEYVFYDFFASIIGSVAERENFKEYYTELLWLFHSFGFLSVPNNVDKMFDIIQSLIRLVGYTLARSFLNYLMLTSEQEQKKIIIPAYYYTRHDVESLELVISTLSHPESNMSELIYTHALIFVSNLQPLQLSENDKEFLTKFFKVGLESDNVSIVDSSKKGLGKLE